MSEAAPVVGARDSDLRHATRDAAAQGVLLSTLVYLFAAFPLALGSAAAIDRGAQQGVLDAVLQSLILGYVVSTIGFLWVLCGLVAALIGFPLAMLVERLLRRTRTDRWRPAAMGLLGALVGAAVILVGSLVPAFTLPVDAPWPWVVIAVAGGISSAIGHWLAHVIRQRSSGHRRAASADHAEP